LNLYSYYPIFQPGRSAQYRHQFNDALTQAPTQSLTAICNSVVVSNS